MYKIILSAIYNLLRNNILVIALKKIILLFLCTIISAHTVWGQSADNDKEKQSDTKFSDRFAWVDQSQVNIHEMNIIGGYSFTSTKGFWGKIPEATLSLYAIRYNRKLFTYNSKHLIEYVTEANLAANYTLTNTDGYQSATYSGFGITPIGFQFNINQKNTIQPFFKSSAGFMLFKKPFPDTRGTQFNFTLELGGGIEFMITNNLSFSAGYKYHHMSNGQFGQINPGVDSNIFYSGITIF